MSTTGLEVSNPTSNWGQQLLENMYTTGDLADVNFVIGLPNEPKATLKGHSMILGVASEVFKAMFYGPNARRGEDNTFMVEITDIDERSFKSLLKFMYLSVLDVQSTEDTFKIYVAANKYLLTELKKVCLAYINQNITPSEVFNIFEFAVSTDDNDLKESVRRPLESSRAEAFNGAESRIIDLKPQSLKALMGDFVLPVFEGDLLNLVFCWCKKQLQDVEPENELKGMQELLLDSGIMKCMNLSRISAARFLGLIERNGLLKTDKCFQFFWEMFAAGSGSPNPNVHRLKYSHQNSKSQKFFDFHLKTNEDITNYLRCCGCMVYIKASKNVTMTGIYSCGYGDISVKLVNDKSQSLLLQIAKSDEPSEFQYLMPFNFGLDMRSDYTYALVVKLENVIKKLHSSHNGKKLNLTISRFLNEYEETIQETDGLMINARVKGWWPSDLGFEFNYSVL